ncbi:MAG: hypothetical protein QN211_09590, partial [Armatimonadota bacterium]|nr:hypothetical protein [Armatimonadota bacterium]
VIVFPKTYEQAHLVLKRDAVVVVRGRVDVTEQQAKVLADRVVPLEEAEEVEPLLPSGGVPEADGNGAEPARPAALHVRVDTRRCGEDGLLRLREVLSRRRGPAPVFLHLITGGREVVMNARDLQVHPSADLQAEIEQLLGAGSVWQE